MKLIGVFSVGVLFCSCLALDENSDARKAIESKYAQISKAFSTKDIKKFQAIFSEDFKGKSPLKPVITRAEILRDFENQMKLMSDVKWTQKIKTFALDKGVASVMFDSEMKAKVKTDDGVSHDFRLTSKTKNEWVQSKLGWVVRYSESLELKTWIDGEEIKPGI